MARPAYGYRAKDDKKVPGVTTILGGISAGMSSDVLCSWAAKLAREGKDWKAERQKAGDHGTLLHEMCEVALPLGTSPSRPEGVPDEQWDKLSKSFATIQTWWEKERPVLLMAEEPLVSERWRFGGTLDGLAQFSDGLPWLFDFKTGSQVGVKEVCQMAAYRELLTECKGIRPVGAILVHAPTKDPGFMRPVRITSEQLDQGWAVFEHALAIYRAIPSLKEVCD